jgi:nitrogen regulatory protein PII 2
MRLRSGLPAKLAEPEPDMKQIIAIIRDERVEETKTALDALGVRGITFLYVTGRGEQKGKINVQEQARSMNRNMRMQLESHLPFNQLPDVMTGAKGSLSHRDYEFTLSFLPKRMIVIISCDEEVNRIVQAIVNSNQTGQHGDGKIFICPMISATRVRTGEQGDIALS